MSEFFKENIIRINLQTNEVDVGDVNKETEILLLQIKDIQRTPQQEIDYNSILEAYPHIECSQGQKDLYAMELNADNLQKLKDQKTTKTVALYNTSKKNITLIHNESSYKQERDLDSFINLLHEKISDGVELKKEKEDGGTKLQSINQEFDVDLNFGFNFNGGTIMLTIEHLALCKSIMTQHRTNYYNTARQIKKEIQDANTEEEVNAVKVEFLIDNVFNLSSLLS